MVEILVTGFLLGWLIFRGYVAFSDGKSFFTWLLHIRLLKTPSFNPLGTPEFPYRQSLEYRSHPLKKQQGNESTPKKKKQTGRESFSVSFWLKLFASIYIYPQTGTFADPETHPLRAFVPFLPGRVLAFGLFFFAFFVASRASVHTWHGHIPKPNVTRVQSATQWTASVHTLHMSKPVM